MKIIISLFFLSLFISIGRADSISEAALLVRQGNFAEARSVLEREISQNPKISANGTYCYLLGVCEYEDGNYEEAAKLLETAQSKGNGDANLYLGRLSFLDYDFNRASEFYDEFRAYRDKKGLKYGDTSEDFERQLLAAENALERVENIVVIDSLSVPATDFFKYYKLPKSAGRLIAPDDMPLKGHTSGTIMAFMNEGEDYLIWGEPDSIGNVRLVESLLLTDGKWQEPVAAPADILNEGGYADFPFMMPDGVTLYYASDGDGSMGGYDIFVVSRDPQTGEYLHPQNLGMPFNSPYHDYMLAIDEENGVGWWATERNCLDGLVTIYVFKTNNVRNNYSPDVDGLIEKARLSDYRSTQNPAEEEDYRGLLETLRNIGNEKVEKRGEFLFPVGDGKYYVRLTDFNHTSARTAMKKYVLAEQALQKSETRLASLRQRYHERKADNVRTQIIQEEKDIEKEREDVRKLRSEVYRLEFERN